MKIPNVLLITRYINVDGRIAVAYVTMWGWFFFDKTYAFGNNTEPSQFFWEIGCPAGVAK